MKLAAAFLAGTLTGYFYAWLRLATDRTDIERRIRHWERSWK